MTSIARPSRPIPLLNALGRNFLCVVRILIASYFLATATGMMLDPARHTFLDPILSMQDAPLVATIFLFAAAFSIMVGWSVRPAALLLAVYVCWSGFVQLRFGAGPEAVTSIWRDMVLLGSVLLIAVTQPGAAARARGLDNSVAPRRIATEKVTRRTLRPVRPAGEAAQLTREAILAGKVAAPRKEPRLKSIETGAARDPEGEAANIFADLWEPGAAASA